MCPVTITVNDVAPSNLSYSTNPAIYLANVPIPQNKPSTSGPGVVTGYSITAGGPLPSGLVLDPSTGIISGTATAKSAVKSYTVKAQNSGGSASTTLVLGVNDGGMEGIDSLATGHYLTCAIVNGGAQCWGQNQVGELGNGTHYLSSVATPLPQQVQGLTSGVQALVTGDQFACALVNGGVWCWGSNSDGQLGINATNATTPYSDVPVQPIGLGSGVEAITAGWFHACALTNGTMKCWGRNNNAEIGTGAATTGDILTPTAVTGLPGPVQAMTAGQAHTCALVNGGMLCWGDCTHGQLGQGSIVGYSATPVTPIGLGSGVSSISAGQFTTCAVVNGGAQCWGENTNGQVGDGTNVDKTAGPVQVSGLTSGVQRIKTTYLSTCALVNGGLMCWGDNSYAEFGNGTTTDSYVPVPGGVTSGVQAFSLGYNQTCALANGVTQCWGPFAYGQLGNNTSGTGSQKTPGPVSGLGTGMGTGVADVATGGSHSCAIVNAGVQCWGLNSAGQLGNNTQSDSNVPVAVMSLSNVQAIALGRVHTCAIVNGGVKCWGDNTNGQLGTGSAGGISKLPVPVTIGGIAISGVTAIAAGGDHTCVIANGSVQCWGFNNSGELGDGTNSTRPSPVTISSLGTGVYAIAAGTDHSCAILGNGAVNCWGKNANGQLGNGTFAPSSTPVLVTGLTGPQSLTAGGAHTCALSMGGLKCWGANGNGQLGDNTTTDRPLPVTPLTLDANVMSVAAGDTHT
jgi:alpha-tubulin suppressor-like RCC1 family protein